jgi:hypothetical protein
LSVQGKDDFKMAAKDIKEFDEMVGRKLGGYTEQPPRDLFARIERSLDKSGMPAVPAAPAHGKVIRRIYRYATAAAILIAVVFSTTLIWDTRPVEVMAEHAAEPSENDAVLDGGTPEKVDANDIPESLAESSVSSAPIRKTLASGMGFEAALAHFEVVNIGGISIPSVEHVQYIPPKRREKGAAADEESRRRMEREREMQIENYWGDLFQRMESVSHGGRAGDSPVASLYAGNFGAGSGDLTYNDLSDLAAGNMMISEVSNSIPSGPLSLAPSSVPADAEPVTLRHMMPLNFGVSLMFPVSGALSIVSGLNYSYLSSSSRQQLSTGEGGVKQELHYVGIPVGVRYSFYHGRVVDLYLRGGGAIEKAVYAKRTMSYNLGKPEVAKMGVRGVQFSVDGAVGADFRIARSMGLYLETGAAYYFEGGHKSANFGTFTSYRTDNPVNFTLRIGIRFNM